MFELVRAETLVPLTEKSQQTTILNPELIGRVDQLNEKLSTLQADVKVELHVIEVCLLL